jgi:hypothetical protein
MVIVFACILVMSLRSFIPALEPVDKTAIILTSTISFSSPASWTSTTSRTFPGTSSCSFPAP